MPSPTIRLARSTELRRIRELEDLAGERYADVGLPADLEGLEHRVIEQAHAAGLLWVVAHEDEPIGFALCWLYPQALHLRELDVHPAWMGKGLGRRLVEHVIVEAKQRGLASVTLTTFRDVSFNAPLYQHLGFEPLDAEKLPKWLRAIRDEEDSGELKRWPRLAMAYALAESPT